MQGIYCIENIVSGRKYYGSSIDVDKRFDRHKRDLVLGSHHNQFMQRSYDKNGEHCFVFYVIEETTFSDRDSLLSLEQEYITENINDGGYNMAPASGGDLLTNHPNRTDIIERMRATQLVKISSMSEEEKRVKWAKYGEDTPNWRNGGVCRKICPKCNTNNIAATSSTCAMCRDRSGENNPFYKRNHTETTKKHLSEVAKVTNWCK